MKSIVFGSPARSTLRLTTVYMTKTCQAEGKKERKKNPDLSDISFHLSVTRLRASLSKGATPLEGCSGHDLALYPSTEDDVRSSQGLWGWNCVRRVHVSASQHQQPPAATAELQRHPHAPRWRRIKPNPESGSRYNEEDRDRAENRCTLGDHRCEDQIT